MTIEKITISRLENFLFKSADILRGKIRASKLKFIIFRMLFIKRLSGEFDLMRLGDDDSKVEGCGLGYLEVQT